LDNRIKDISVILLALLAGAFAILNMLVPSAFSLALAVGTFLIFRGKGRDEISMERDVAELLNGALSCDSHSPTIEMIRSANKERYPFYADLKNAVDFYRISGSTSSFSDLERYGSRPLSKLSGIVSYGLENSQDVRPSLSRLRDKLERSGRSKSRLFAQIKSARSVSQLGSVIFFPMFAGVSVNIMAFAAGTITSFSYSWLVPIILFYIIVSNVIGFEYSGEASVNFAKMGSLSASSGLLVFRIVSLFSAVMLR
jgi:hypothetical protein